MSIQGYQRDLNHFFAGREPDRKEIFEDLSGNEEDCRQIKNLLETFNRIFEEEPNFMRFGIRYSLSLWRCGRRLQHLHPLMFYDRILESNELTDLAKKIYAYQNDAFIWLKKFFLSGLERSFQIEFENDNLLQHVKGFCRRFPEKENSLRELVLQKQWRGFTEEVFEVPIS